MHPVDWVTVIVSVAINTPAIAGLLGWLGKRKLARESAKHNEKLESLRANYARELEAYRSSLETSKQLFQAEIDKTIIVTKVHFETEFDALKLGFSKLAALRLQISGLRPFFDVLPTNDTDAAKLTRLAGVLSKVQAAYNELIDVTENLKPFYPSDIYTEIEECRKSAWMEMTDIQTSRTDVFTSPWYDRGQRNLERFLKAYTSVSNMIRDRVSQLTVIRE